jgi:hypothetical protein
MFFEKDIEFSIHSDLINLKNIHPEEAKKNLPNWYKKIDKHTLYQKNIKGCIPFLDCISAGYVLPLPQDLFIGHNVVDKSLNPEERKSFLKYSLPEGVSEELCTVYNLNGASDQLHTVYQIGGPDNFMAKKNGSNNQIIKILNPWKIKTPPGYSSLFVSPFYNENDYFSIISAIVDTDVFDDHINFPIIINNDKYPSFEKIFKQGIPYVQIIPFKRDSWKKKISKKIISQTYRLKYFTQILNRYRDLIWQKKTWK